MTDADVVMDACSTEESASLRRQLKILGPQKFIDETINNGKMTMRKLVTALGVKPPAFLNDMPDHMFAAILRLAIERELSRREKLPEYNTIDDAVSLLKNSKNIIVLTGAGISTSLGIPDFRSKENGLYTQLADLGLQDPQEVFDIHLFREDPKIFYSVAKDILPGSKRFSPTHAFIRLLQDKSKLLTNFTQNIDNLESHAGIDPARLVQCHGSFATATCIQCRTQVPGETIHKDLKAGQVARCTECLRRLRQFPNGLLNPKRKRSSTPSSNASKSRKKRRNSWSDSSSEEDEDDDLPVAGVMKPDITFFGEDLPKAFHDRLVLHDKDIVDLVVVIGTSLKVAPVSEVVGVVPPSTPQIYINRDPCSHVDFDVELLGECDTIVAELCRRAGWQLQHEMCKKKEVDVTLVEGTQSQWKISASTQEQAAPILGTKPMSIDADAVEAIKRHEAASTSLTAAADARSHDPAPRHVPLSSPPPPTDPATTSTSGSTTTEPPHLNSALPLEPFPPPTSSK